ncbi:haloacid dehalogenase type II [Mangrovihabitans endophyticus]|uniref:Haloacid dehalogenase n=1 Tax=Mangrovihabitans endophyticus TaxID=1751298 RepID=A0A8J3BWD4_9ACTN|nr:haloacid dehalogenase type II [Mangrovihabitans endophyticus]GGK73595.1 haloacid dehalogenase [Mangrovihabitans endophyticus]
MAKVIAFDVNETLLDLRGLDGPFTEVFGDAALRPLWFAQMLQLSFVGGLVGDYVDFTTAQHAALRMLAERTGTALTDDEADRIVGGMSALSPHPEVPAALTRLRGTSLLMVALTNSVGAVAEAQLEHAGLRALFDAVLSADAVRHLKPEPQPYRSVAEHFGVPIAEVRLVAAHSWDVSGALAAGCRAALVRRPGVTASPIGAQPDIVAPDLAATVERIIEVDRPRARADARR